MPKQNAKAQLLILAVADRAAALPPSHMWGDKHMLRRIGLMVCLSLLTSCDQIGNRYEITKDQSGRTLRLDKRTGEVAVIEGERIAPIRSAKDVDAEKQVTTRSLADAKNYPPVPLHQLGVNAVLRTSWQDGKLLYAVTFKSLNADVPKPSADQAGMQAGKAESAPDKTKQADWHRFDRTSFWLVLEDTPFELARVPLSTYNIWDDNEKVIGKEAKGSIVMSSDTYTRIDVWNMMWSGSR